MYIRKLKFFLASNYKKEEDWLNLMASKGLLFKKFCFFVYKFEKGEPNSYTYKIDLLEQTPKNSKDYLNFLEEMGVECVDSYIRWVYLRKKGGDFSLYSDLNSKINALSKIQSFLTAVSCLLIFIFTINFLSAFSKTEVSILNAFAALFVGLLGIFFIIRTIKHAFFIHSLKKQNTIIE